MTRPPIIGVGRPGVTGTGCKWLPDGGCRQAPSQPVRLITKESHHAIENTYRRRPAKVLRDYRRHCDNAMKATKLLKTKCERLPLRVYALHRKRGWSTIGLNIAGK